MSGQSIGMFLHIAGGLGMAAVLALEWTGLRQIWSAMLPEQVRPWLETFRSANRVMMVSMLLNVLTGIFMMVTVWGRAAWIIVSLGSALLMPVLAMALTRPQLAAIGQALATEKRPVSQTLHGLANHPLLWISIQTRVALLLGILLLMIAKPGWGGSLLVIGVAFVLGIASALPVLRREPVHEVSAD